MIQTPTVISEVNRLNTDIVCGKILYTRGFFASSTMMNARAISERLHKRYSSSSVGNFDADLQSNKINTTTRFFPGPNDDKLEIKIKQTASDL